MKFQLGLCLIVGSVLSLGCKNPLSHKSEERTLAPFQKSAVTLVGSAGKKTNAVTFQQLSGQLTLSGDEPTAVNVKLQTSSLAASDPKLNTKLKDKDNFEVEKFATATFQSKNIQAVKTEGSKDKNYTVSGDLNIKGKVIPVVAPATMSTENNDVILMIQLTASKEDWAKASLGKVDDFFSDNVDVIAKLTFPKNNQIEEKKK